MHYEKTYTKVWEQAYLFIDIIKLLCFTFFNDSNTVHGCNDNQFYEWLFSEWINYVLYCICAVTVIVFLYHCFHGSYKKCRQTGKILLLTITVINVNLNTEYSNYSFEQQKSHWRCVSLLIQTAAQKTQRQESLTSNSYKLESVGLIGSRVFRMGATHHQPYPKKWTVWGWAPSTRASSPPPLRDSQSMSVFIKRKLHLQTFMRILSSHIENPNGVIAFIKLKQQQT